MKRFIDISFISKYRTHIMGLAAFMILCCHAEPRGVAMPNWLSWLLQWGNYGVDIFLLLSGLGLFFSLRKSDSLFKWYKKRYCRILVPYAIISSVYWVYYCVVNNLGIVEFIIQFSTIGYWTNHTGAWFVALLIPLYALTPIYDKLYAKVKNKGLLTILGVIVILLLSSIDTMCAVCNNIEAVTSRLPSFFVGFYVGDVIYNKKLISLANLVMVVVASVVAYLLLNHFCVWIRCSALLTMPVMLIAIVLIAMLKNCNVLIYLGSISLESYLFNIYLGDVLTTSFPQYANLWGYSVIVVIGLLLSLAVHRLSDRLIIKMTN